MCSQLLPHPSHSASRASVWLSSSDTITAFVCQVFPFYHCLASRSHRHSMMNAKHSSGFFEVCARLSWSLGPTWFPAVFSPFCWFDSSREDCDRIVCFIDPVSRKSTLIHSSFILGSCSNSKGDAEPCDQNSILYYLIPKQSSSDYNN